MSNAAPAARLSRCHRLMAALLAAWLVLLGAAALWHPLHECLHPDADDHDHECGVTLFAMGHVCADAPVVAEAPPVPVVWIDAVALVETRFVEGSFARLSVLEHAPPRPA